MATSKTRTHTGQIIAMGGGGFSMEPDNPLLDQYALDQAHSKRPRVCFLGTASGDAASYIEMFYSAFTKLDCEPTHVNLFRTPPPNIDALFRRQHVFYVGGGSTRSLLALWREWGIDRLVKREWRRGAVLCGLSAGSLCWYESGVTDSYSTELRPIHALGMLSGSHCPHYDGEALRRPAYHALVKRRAIDGGVAADDGAALHYVGRTLHRVVSSRPNAKAYTVRNVRGTVVERPLETHYLGG